MNLLKLIAGLAIACMTTAAYSQGCAGHSAATTQTIAPDPMASLTKELNLTADQQKSFTTAMASCEKDCAAMASIKDEKEFTSKKESRFKESATAMRATLTSDQTKRFDEMNASGELMKLCCGGHGCCAGKTSGCCAGKHAEAPKSQGVQ